MKRVLFTTLVAIVWMLAFTGAIGRADDDDRNAQREFQADLRGRNEVPVTLSAAQGELKLTINEAETSVHFVLTFEGLLTPVLFSHIHIGQPNVNGGVTVFFCGGGGRPPCPQQHGMAEGDIMAADVIGLPTQQLEPNNLAKVIAAIRAGHAYANLHTMTSPGGEIRGQIHGLRHDRDKD